MNKSRAKELLELNMYTGYLIRDKEGKVPSYSKITELKRLLKVFNENSIYGYDSILKFLIMG